MGNDIMALLRFLAKGSDAMPDDEELQQMKLDRIANMSQGGRPVNDTPLGMSGYTPEDPNFESGLGIGQHENGVWNGGKWPGSNNPEHGANPALREQERQRRLLQILAQGLGK